MSSNYPADLIAFKWAESLSSGVQSVLLASSLRDLQQSIAAALVAAHAAGLEAGAVIADGWANSPSCTEEHTDTPCCHVRTGYGISTSIRTAAAKGRCIHCDPSFVPKGEDCWCNCRCHVPTAAKCAHGVLWSMECLSCGSSDYVAAAKGETPGNEAHNQ